MYWFIHYTYGSDLKPTSGPTYCIHCECCDIFMLGVYGNMHSRAIDFGRIV